MGHGDGCRVVSIPTGWTAILPSWGVPVPRKVPSGTERLCHTQWDRHPPAPTQEGLPTPPPPVTPFMGAASSPCPARLGMSDTGAIPTLAGRGFSDTLNQLQESPHVSRGTGRRWDGVVPRDSWARFWLCLGGTAVF